MLSTICMTLFSGVLTLSFPVETPAAYEELSVSYVHAVESVLPLHANCKLVRKPLGTDAEVARYATKIPELRKLLSSIPGKDAAEQRVKKDIEEEIASLEFILQHPPVETERFFTFLTDGDSFQLRMPTDGKLPDALPAPDVDNLAEHYARITLFSYSTRADEPQYRLWSGLIAGEPSGQVSNSPFLQGRYQLPPVGHVNPQWGDTRLFSALDRIMTIDEANQVTVHRHNDSLVVETILSETSWTTNADGQSGDIRQQEFLRAFIDPRHAPWPHRVERGQHRFFHGKQLNKPYPAILETTEVVKFQSLGDVRYPRTIVTTRYAYRGDGKELPTFSHYVNGGSFDIPYEPVLVETLEITLSPSDASEANYSLEFPAGMKPYNRDLNGR